MTTAQRMDALPADMRAVADAYTEWLRYGGGLAESSVKKYLGSAAWLLSWLHEHEVPLAGMDKVAVRGWLAEVQSSAPASMQRHSSVLASFCRWAYRHRHLDIDLEPLLWQPKQGLKLPDVMPVTRIQKLFDTLADPDVPASPGQLRDLAVLELLYSCGLRVSEVCAQDLNSIVWARRLVRVVGKGDVERMVPFGALAEQAFKVYLADGRPPLAAGGDAGEALIVGDNGRRITDRDIRRMLTRLAEAAGTEHVHPHMLRHSFATDLMEGGANLFDVQAMLGHVNVRTTQIYTHVSMSLRRAVYQRAHPRASGGETGCEPSPL